jgi:hypothetical protein
MFDKWRIKEHMEVMSSDGQHLGTVDKVDGDVIKLTKSDSSDGQHHTVSAEQIDRVEDNRLYLNVGRSALSSVS